MPQPTVDQRRVLQALSDLTYCNPFEPQRIELERLVLGDAYQPESIGAWSRTEATTRLERANVVAINEVASDLAEELKNQQLLQGSFTGADAALYDDLVTYTLYYRHIATLKRAQLDPAGDDRQLRKVWRAFRDEREEYHASLLSGERRKLAESAHLFACLHQVRRAFNGIFDCLIGESAPATRLRAQVWQSIFTHDLRRYRRTLYCRMADLSTLVTGPSGAGKELVAQAIGHAQYRAFDPEREAMADGGASFVALNLSALSPTLIESELFGHSKGAFTGATADRVGWLERCATHGAVFLDEIGELDPALQVKLLRVAQSRDYSRLGDCAPRRFVGKLITATNRDLAAEMRAGRFREDLYYRLCSDRVVAPSLADQLADRPEARHGLVRFLVWRVLGGPAHSSPVDESEADTLTNEVESYITRELPADYAWPGNIRELEQCVRSVLVRHAYRPPSDSTSESTPDWLSSAQRGELTADELLDAYCRHVHGKVGGYEPAARVLGLDRRTVKSRVTKTADGD